MESMDTSGASTPVTPAYELGGRERTASALCGVSDDADDSRRRSVWLFSRRRTLCGSVSSVQNNARSTTGGITGAGFVPGRSGNPSGRPRGLARIIRELVGDDGRQIAEFWLATMSNPTARLAERLEASRLLADRGWGKAAKGEPTAEEMAPTPHRTLADVDREIELLCADLATRDQPVSLDM